MKYEKKSNLEDAWVFDKAIVFDMQFVSFETSSNQNKILCRFQMHLRRKVLDVWYDQKARDKWDKCMRLFFAFKTGESSLTS